MPAWGLWEEANRFDWLRNRAALRGLLAHLGPEALSVIRAIGQPIGRSGLVLFEDGIHTLARLAAGERPKQVSALEKRRQALLRRLERMG